MEETEGTAPAPEKIVTLQDTLLKAGKLNYSIERTLSVVRSIHPEIAIDLLKQDLDDPTTEEYQIFYSGKNAQDYEIESAMFDEAAGGSSFAQEALERIQKRNNLDQAIQEKFFPSEDY